MKLDAAQRETEGRRAQVRRSLLALQREEALLRGVELHLLASGDLKIASGRGVPAGLLARLAGLPWRPADPDLPVAPADIPAWLEVLQIIRHSRLKFSPGFIAALDRIAA